MTNQQNIKKIAKVSRKIVEEADVQKLTMEDEVEAIVLDLLSDPDTLAKIEHDALFKASERLYNEHCNYARTVPPCVNHGSNPKFANTES